MTTQYGPGFTFGGQPSSDFGIYMNKKQIDLLPKSRDIEQVIYGRAGQYDYGTELDQRWITLTLTMMGTDRTDLLSKMRSFAALLDPRKGYQQLIFDDDPTRYYSAKYSSQTEPQVDLIMNIAQFQLTLKCDDPFIYSTTAREDWWAAPLNGQTVLTNNGSVECPLVIQIQAPSNAQPPGSAGLGTTGGGTSSGASSTSGVTITINGVSVTYAGEISGSDIVEIDTGNYTVTLNGQNALQYWSGDFPILQPGDNTVIETDRAGVGANITFTFRERWI